jgi:hypothetical protein
MPRKTDQRTLNLIKEVNRQKNEISQAERPSWITNCSFSYSEGRQNDQINLHVESKVQTLILIAAFLSEKSRTYYEAAGQLGVDAPQFTWSGYSVNDWLSDIKSRINEIQIASKRKKLEALEARLNAIVSPELRAEMESEAIMGELGTEDS